MKTLLTCAALLVGLAFPRENGMVERPKLLPVVSAPTGLRLRPVDATDSARFVLTWTPPVGAIGFHVRLVPAATANPTWPADYGNGLIYHQFGARTLDTLALAYPAADSVGPYKVAVRACDSIGCGSFATVATVTRTPFYVRAAPSAAPTPAAPPPKPDTVAALVFTQPMAYGGLVGDTVRYVANAISASYAPLPCSFAWQSSNPTVAVVVRPGVVVGVGPGWDTVTASCRGLSQQSILNFGRDTVVTFTRVGIDGLGWVSTTGMPSLTQTGRYLVKFTDSAGVVVARGTLIVTVP